MFQGIYQHPKWEKYIQPILKDIYGKKKSIK